MDNDFCNYYHYLEIFGGINLRKFPLLTKCVHGRIETFSMSASGGEGIQASEAKISQLDSWNYC